MFFFRNGFYIMCKAKDLKQTLRHLGSPDTKIVDLLNSRLN
ncbi:MAG TPA: hypothetical protein VNU93_00545 [Verrucomicrobiae bacterium]|nr:hypothetical protein [Verrucomicrobiae bacterium]